MNLMYNMFIVVYRMVAVNIAKAILTEESPNTT